MAFDGSIKIDTKIDETGFNKGIESLKGSSIIGAAAITAAIGTATLAVGTFIKSGIELASDLNEVQNVVDVTFGNMSGKINEWAKNAGTQFGLSELAAKQYSSTLGAMMKSAGLSGEALVDMSEGLANLSGDMASFYNLSTDEAFEKIRSGISGESEPLKQLGIDLSETALQQYALSQGIEKSTSSMSQSEKMTLRYGLLMQQTADAQGDFARTSDGFANQQRILKMQTESAAASLGTALLPMLTSLFSYLNTTAIPAFMVFIEHLKGIPAFVEANQAPLTALAVVIGIITTAMMLQNAVSAIKAFANVTEATTLGGLIAATWAQVAAQTALLLPYIAIVAAIAAVIAIVILLVKHWDDVKAKALEIGAAIGAAFEAAKNAVTNVFEAIKQRIADAVAAVANLIPQMVDAGGNLIAGLWQGIGNKAAWLRDKIAGFFGGVVDNIKHFFGIASPSKLFEKEIGYNLILGLGKGFEDNASGVVSDMIASVDSEMGRFAALTRGTASAAVAYATRGNGSTTNNTNTNKVTNNIYISEGAIYDMDSLLESVKDAAGLGSLPEGAY